MHPTNGKQLESVFGKEIPTEVAVAVDKAAVAFEIMGGGPLPAATVAAIVAPFMKDSASIFKNAKAEEKKPASGPVDWKSVTIGSKIIAAYAGKEMEGTFIEEIKDGILRVKIDRAKYREVPAAFVRLAN